MKIVHIITSLEDGGAENLLYKICKYDNSNNHIVISIISEGKYFSIFKKMGVEVYCMNINFCSFLNLFNFIILIKQLKPDVVQTWLIIGDFLGSIVARLAGVKNIIWTVVYSKFDNSIEKKRNILLVKILAKLSYIIPKSIIVVSKDSKKNCWNLGYQKNKIRLINSGFDTSYFKIDKHQRLLFKEKINIKNNTPILGIIARYHPVKDHQNLLKALSIVSSKNLNFTCLFVGSDMNKNNKTLFKEIKRLKIENNVKLLGSINNIPMIMNAIDINVLCSKSEGFPSVIAEAMACGTPSIVTNVGDSALIVGSTGWVIPPQNSKKLAKTIEKAMKEIGKKNWTKKCFEARLRIKKNFGINKMIESYNSIWSQYDNKKI
jgi:glycosyltransferase involved in cell wall biosynthesis